MTTYMIPAIDKNNIRKKNKKKDKRCFPFSDTSRHKHCFIFLGIQ